MSFIVTGAAGFIGSNIIAGLNARGIDAIIAVDDLTQGDKFLNLVDLKIADYIDCTDFYKRFTNQEFGPTKAVFHEGACSDTLEADGRYMMHNNYTLSCELFSACQIQKVPFIYASSAATYGSSTSFTEDPKNEGPLNVYGYSKLLFDQYVRHHLGTDFSKTQSQVVGLRYFNVYGPREQHKKRMASVAFHQFHQYRETDRVKLFEGHAGYKAGDQQRDFISVEDAVAINLWFLDHPKCSGIFNVGTGNAEPFNAVALAVINSFRTAKGLPSLNLQEVQAEQLIEYITFPQDLKAKYQNFTQADLTRLRQVGCDHEFLTVAQGVSKYIAQLIAQVA